MYGKQHKAQKFALKGYRKVALGGWGETEAGLKQRAEFNAREAQRRALALDLDSLYTLQESSERG